MAFQTKNFNSIVASMINWISSNTSAITDFNIGSVTRTIAEAVALELEELYYQLLTAVQEAIQEAIYRTFNFPRNPAVPATGNVRFYRRTGTTPLISIPSLSIVATAAQPPIYFQTQADSYIPTINGIATGGSTTSLIDTTTNFVNAGVILGSVVTDVTHGGTTQSAGVLSISTTTNANDTLNFSPLTNAVIFGAGDTYQVIVQYVDISVQAQASGSSGNVSANSITSLISTIANIDSINNIASFGTGQDEETDLARQARFALYIQSLARATRGALEYAARTIPEIMAALAVDDVRATTFQEYIDTVVSGPPSITWVDITPAMRNPGDAAIGLFRDTPKINDAVYFGAIEIFDYINMHLVTPGVLTGTPPIWEYWNGAWTTLPVTDGTSNLTKSGTISFAPPGDWIATIIVLGNTTYNLMWIRLRIDIVGVVYTTIPTGDWCSLPPGFGYVYLYCHDGSGQLNANLQASVESAVELYRGCGIIVEVLAPTLYNPTITVELLIANNYDPNTVAINTAQTIINWLNAKILGQDVYVASLYQLIMDSNTQAILNTNITECSLSGATGQIMDLIIPSSAVVRPNPAIITVTATTV